MITTGLSNSSNYLQIQNTGHFSISQNYGSDPIGRIRIRFFLKIWIWFLYKWIRILNPDQMSSDRNLSRVRCLLGRIRIRFFLKDRIRIRHSGSLQMDAFTKSYGLFRDRRVHSILLDGRNFL